MRKVYSISEALHNLTIIPVTHNTRRSYSKYVGGYLSQGLLHRVRVDTEINIKPFTDKIIDDILV